MDEELLRDKSRILIILGPPGSGKGTQAKLLSKFYDFAHFSPGALLRELRNSDKRKLDKKTREELIKIDNGKMVEHWLVYEIMFPKIENAISRGKSVIIDGAIRTKEQAKGYTEFFKKNGYLQNVLVLWIAVDKRESVKRLNMRLVREGNKFVKRMDDASKKAMEYRFKTQGNRSQIPVLNYLKKFMRVEKIDGNGKVEDVEKRLFSVLLKCNIV